MSEITITLALTRDEANKLNAQIRRISDPDLIVKVTRAIERAESFVDAVDSLGPGVNDEYETVETVNSFSVQDCAGCEGIGMFHYDEKPSENCYFCSGTGKEYV